MVRAGVAIRYNVIGSSQRTEDIVAMVASSLYTCNRNTPILCPVPPPQHNIVGTPQCVHRMVRAGVAIRYIDRPTRKNNTYLTTGIMHRIR